MQEKVLRKDAIADFIGRLIRSAKTIAPVAKPGGFYQLEPVSDPAQVALACPITYYSAKAYLFPPHEALVRFDRKEGKPCAEALATSEGAILFGLHPCDANAVWLYDAVFEKDNADANYLERRNRTAIIGMDCLKPCDEHAFCHDMKTNVPQGGYDLFLTDIGDAYFVRVATDRGAELLGDAEAPSEAQRAALADAESAKEAAFKKRIEFDTDDLPKVLEQSYDSLVWTAVSKRCFSCGSCVLVCPTCYCFDVEDRLNLDLISGERWRRWDGCMLPGFAEVAGGENFRPDRPSRLRHRMFRKGKFIRETFNRPGCVGCGRCDRACTSDISIVATYNQLKGGV